MRYYHVEKIQQCKYKQNGYIDILNSNSYCLLSSIALLYLKMKIKKNYFEVIVHY